MAFVRVPGNEPPDGAEEHWLEGRGGVRLRVLTAPPTVQPARGSVILCFFAAKIGQQSAAKPLQRHQSALIHSCAFSVH